MADVRSDPRRPIDPAINSPGREGLTGTAPANLYAPGFEREQITIAPDFAPADANPPGGRTSRSTGRRIFTSSVGTS